jgi:hypothetical protein
MFREFYVDLSEIVLQEGLTPQPPNPVCGPGYRQWQIWQTLETPFNDQILRLQRVLDPLVLLDITRDF